MSSPWSRAVIAALLVLAVGGCSPAHMNPACNYRPDRGGDGAVGDEWGLTKERHAFGTGAPVTLCMHVLAGYVRLVSSAPGVAISPAMIQAPSADDTFTFTVTVSSGQGGLIYAELLAEDGKTVGAGFGAPGVWTDATGWAFGRSPNG